MPALRRLALRWHLPDHTRPDQTKNSIEVLRPIGRPCVGQPTEDRVGSRSDHLPLLAESERSIRRTHAAWRELRDQQRVPRPLGRPCEMMSCKRVMYGQLAERRKNTSPETGG